MLPGTDWADQWAEGVNKPQTEQEAAEWAEEYAESAWAQEFQAPPEPVVQNPGLGPWAKPEAVPTQVPPVQTMQEQFQQRQVSFCVMLWPN